MPTLTSCPSCARSLKIPDDFLGKQVKCPVCFTEFEATGQPPEPPVPFNPLPPELPPTQSPAAAPPADWSAPPEPPPGWPIPPEPPAWSAPPPREPARREPSPPPTAGDARAYVRAQVLPPAVALMLTGGLGLLIDALFLAGAVFRALGGRGHFNVVSIGYAASALVGLALSALVLVGAYQMLKMRNYRLAVAGTIVAAINLPCCCSLLGVPFGVWALVTLNDPLVRAAFQSAPPRLAPTAE